MSISGGRTVMDENVKCPCWTCNNFEKLSAIRAKCSDEEWKFLDELMAEEGTTRKHFLSRIVHVLQHQGRREGGDGKHGG